MATYGHGAPPWFRWVYFMENHLLQDRLEDAISSLRQLSTRAELLQPSATAEATAAACAAGTAPEWQRRVWRAEGELKELRLV